MLNTQSEECNMVFYSCLACSMNTLIYVRGPVIYRVHQAEYGIRIRLVAPHEYVNIYSTRRYGGPPEARSTAPPR